MHADSTFSVTSFEPTDYVSPVVVGSPVGHAHMTKEFSGDVVGSSATQFSAVYDQESGVGTYVAMEAFGGSVGGVSGGFAFAHSATTDGQSSARLQELFVLVPGSGSGGLAGITGTGSMRVDEDGTHRVTLDYELPA